MRVFIEPNFNKGLEKKRDHTQFFQCDNDHYMVSKGHRSPRVSIDYGVFKKSPVERLLLKDMKKARKEQHY